MVFVKLQPYVQSTLANYSNRKLSFKYFGPFSVVARVGTVAYQLQLPPTTSVHPVFHVSQLKPAVTPGVQVSTSFPADIELPCVPISILQRQVMSTGSGSVEQGLVQWSDWPPGMAT